MSSARGLLIRLTARRVFYSGLSRDTAATACSSTRSDAVTPTPTLSEEKVPQRASRKDDVGPVKRAAYAHIMRTGRFPTFDELKAELRATVAAGGNGNQRSAPSLLQADESPSTPKLGHGGAPVTLPRPPAFASLPFNDDPPPQPAAVHEPPPQPAAALTPTQQAVGERSDVVAVDTPVTAAAEEHAAALATLPLVTDARSSLQLLPVGGITTNAVSALATAQPGANAVSTVTPAEPGSDAVSTVAAAQPAEGLVHGQELPPPPSGPREPEDGESGERGEDGDDKNPIPELLRNAIVLVLLSSAMVVLAYAVYEAICDLFRDRRRTTPLSDGMVEKQVNRALRRRFDKLRAEMEADFERLAVQQQQLVGVAMAQWAAAHDEELRKASEELVAELAARRGQ